MKKTTLALVGLLAVWAMILTGCNKNEEVVNEAKEFCLNNWWTHEIQTSETAVYGVCILPDGTECDEWEYLDWTCPNNNKTIEEETNEEETISDEKLTIEDLDKIDEENFPKWYTYSEYNSADESKDEWSYTYPEDISHTLLLPIHATMASREIISSGIEDGMIYTLTKATLQDETEVQILYIVNPKTKDYVAATVENWTTTTNYQFIY